MTEELTTDQIIVLCPECKCNQPGVVGEETLCINPKCEKTFVADDQVPVIVPEPEED